MHYSKWQLSFAVTLLLCRCEPAVAQTADPQPATPAPVSRDPAFTVRSLSISTGYAFVQLPPITLGGYLPSQALENDLITTAAGDVGWRKSRRGLFFDVDVNAYYSGQVKYSQIGGLGSSGS